MEKYDIIIENGASICYNRKGDSISALKTGGRIKVIVKPNSVKGLIIALENTSDDRVVLGYMTNTLISDKGIDKEVVLTSSVKGINISGNKIVCAAGESLSNACILARKFALSGMEGLSGIPGSIGGAIAMNAGAFGGTMSDIVESAQVYLDGKVVCMSREQLGMSYRYCNLLDSGGVIVEATLSLTPRNPIIIASNMKETRTKRQKTQPLEVSLGSVFKRTSDNSAGYYIEKCGLKGCRIGDALVSTKHANFIINTGKCTSNDYYQLMCHIQKTVQKECGVILQREVRLIGEFEE